MNMCVCVGSGLCSGRYWNAPPPPLRACVCGRACKWTTPLSKTNSPTNPCLSSRDSLSRTPLSNKVEGGRWSCDTCRIHCRRPARVIRHNMVNDRRCVSTLCKGLERANDDCFLGRSAFGGLRHASVRLIAGQYAFVPEVDRLAKPTHSRCDEKHHNPLAHALATAHATATATGKGIVLGEGLILEPRGRT